MLKKHYLLAFILIINLIILPLYGQNSTKGDNDVYTKRSNELVARGKRNQSKVDSIMPIVAEFKALYKLYNNPESLVYAAYYKANYEWLTANHVGAMQDAINALNLAQKHHVVEPLSIIHSMIGTLHKENTNYPMAFKAADKALEAARNNADTIDIISALGMKAMFKRSFLKHFFKPLKSDTSSINMQFEGLRLAESNAKYERLRIRFYDNIAQHYNDIEEYSKGIEYAKKGIALATKLDEKRSLTYGYNWLGDALFYSGKREEGIKNVKKALDIAIAIKQPYRIMELYEAMANCYRYAADYKSALYYKDKWSALRDSMNVQTNEKLMGEMQIKYESVKKDKDLAISNQAFKDRTKLLKWLSLGFLIFLGLLILLIYLYYVIRVNNKTLELKNKKINEQSSKLQILVQELHHRVKNNLQIVSSLLTLQSNRMTDNDARQALDVSRQRIEAMAIIHSSLYQHDSANKVDMKEFLPELLRSILESFGINAEEMDINTEINVADIDVDIAMPLGLIMNEWLTNVFKHAYQQISDRHVLSINIMQTANEIQLQIIDNGVGMPLEVWENPTGTFGIKLMKILIKQLGGTPNILNNKGTIFNLHIPYTAVTPTL